MAEFAFPILWKLVWFLNVFIPETKNVVQNKINDNE